MRELKKIYITPEEPSAEEPRLIMELLERGWTMAHLRHPDATLRQMRQIIESIDQRFHGRLRLHGHFTLAAEFNLGGLHLNKRCPTPPDFYSGPVSRSCHSIKEVSESSGCDYVTLSPVFDSVSKPGYHAAFSPDELDSLNELREPDVIALGGVTPERVDLLRRWNFAGYAVKGAINEFIKIIK